MDVSSEGARRKKKVRSDEDDKWECSVCTYINSKEAYKCEICFMRKGTSTRKPRPNPQVLEQQQLIAQAILKEKEEEHRKKKSEKTHERNSSKDSNVKLKNFDRSSPLLFEIFANGYTVVITEFPPKTKGKLPHFPDSPAASNCSSLLGHSGASAIPEQLSPTDSNSTTADAACRVYPFVDSEFGDGLDAKAKHAPSISFKSLQSAIVKSHSGCSDQSPLKETGASPSVHSAPDSTQVHKRNQSGYIRSTRPRARKIQTNVKIRRRRRDSRTVVRSVAARRVPSRVSKTKFRTNLLSAQPVASNDMKLVISSRRKRGFDDTCSHVPVKRRKVNVSSTKLSLPNSGHHTTRQSSRISTAQVHQGSRQPSPSDAKSSSEDLAPTTAKKIDNGKRYVSTPSELKCRIRVVSPDVSGCLTAVSTPGEHSKQTHSPNGRFTGPSATEPVQVVSDNPTRLSTDSKNTSAMTDSAGATALEISG